MWEYAGSELFWNIVIFGTPMLIAWWLIKRDKKKIDKIYNERRKSIIQKENDSKIFKTVEEFRNDSR